MIIIVYLIYCFLAISSADKRVVPVDGSHPSMAAIVLLQGTTRLIHGSAIIINDKWLLTVAHNRMSRVSRMNKTHWVEIPLSDLKVYPGSKGEPFNGPGFEIEDFPIHDEWKNAPETEKVYFDIGLVKLKSPMPLSESLRAGTFEDNPSYSNDSYSAYNKMTLAAYGTGNQSFGLSEVWLNLAETQGANVNGKSYGSKLLAYDTAEGTFSLCDRDSGGALITKAPAGQDVVVGVHSFGYGSKDETTGCHQQGASVVPSIYKDWIIKRINSEIDFVKLSG